jgi:hypothetical protein
LTGSSWSYSAGLAVVGVRRVVAQLRVLQHLAQRVDAEAVDAAVEPEAQDAEHRLAQLGLRQSRSGCSRR